MNTKQVAYFYDPDIGSYYYGPGHPMKPQRMRMVHSLILAYDLYRHMDIYKPHKASYRELIYYHDYDYIECLSTVNTKSLKESSASLKKFNLGDSTDCPVFDGLYEFQQMSAGASVDAAHLLNNFRADICINWSGGLHHAKRAEASGFCYINDIVLAILELLKYHPRVLYIDIDIHHGDGVEEAFYTTNRVMTVSFHKFGDFFPGTGDITDVGAGPGKLYAVNVPLNDGIDDDGFIRLFKVTISKVMDVYQPGAIVLQCGADSVAGDRLGKFNLSSEGHGECLRYCKSFHVPLLILGGGGYTIRNVSRTWGLETGIILDKDESMSDTIPVNDYLEYYSPQHQLRINPDPSMKNVNTERHLVKLQNKILKNLNSLEYAPGIQMAYVPKDFFTYDEDDDETEAQTIFWEGGGLAAGAGETICSTSPQQNFLIRKSDHNSEYFDKTEEGVRGLLNIQNNLFNIERSTVQNDIQF